MNKSEKFRNNLSNQRKGKNNPMYGKKLWLGRHHSEETKKKISESQKKKLKK